MEPRGFVEKCLEVGLARDLVVESGRVVSGQPADQLVHLMFGAPFPLRLLDVHRVDLRELDGARVHSSHWHAPPRRRILPVRPFAGTPLAVATNRVYMG